MFSNLRKIRSFRLAFAALLCFSGLLSKAQNIYSVVGTGSSGSPSDGVSAISSALVNPNGMGFDATGNMYICDVNDHTIRKVNLTTGVITTIAGTHGSAGSSGDGGAATSALINYPCNIVFDASGNLYFTDLLAHKVRMINTSGIISTFAGTGTAGSSGDGGAATSATLNQPTGLVIDKLGNLYVAEINGHRIRKINTSGIISTFAGTGTASSTGDGSLATAATLNKPRGMIIDTSGNIYVVEENGHRVRKINTSNIISTLAGNGTASSTGDGGASTSATVNSPRGITMDSLGNIFFTEGGGSRVRKITPGGTISTFAGTGSYGFSGDGGAATSATIKYTMDIAMFRNNIYFTDYDAATVRMICTGGPVAPSVSASVVSYCQGATASALGATGYTLKWYATQTGGSSLGASVTPSTATAGAYYYYVAQTYYNAGCESPRVRVQVNINPKPDSVQINALSATSFCVGDSVTLRASAKVKTVANTAFFNATGRPSGTFSCNCPNGSVAVGYSGGTGDILDGFRLYCKQINRYGVLGSTSDSTNRNGGGGGGLRGPYLFTGTNVLVGGFASDAYWYGTGAYQLNKFQAYGQSIASIKTFIDNTSSPVSLTALSGISGDNVTGTLFVPDGYVVTGMTGSNEAYSTTVSLQYAPIRAFEYSYSWSTGDTTDNIVVRNAGSYTLTVTNAYGCSATSAATTVTVNPMPVPVIDTSAPEICLGQSVTMNASAPTKGNAIDFSGSAGNYITIPNASGNSLAGSSNFTVSMWVYPRSNRHQTLLFHGLGCSSWANWTLNLGGFEAGNEVWAKKLGFSFMTVNGGGLRYIGAADTVVPNQWVHVAVTYDGSQLKIYLNGTLSNTVAATGVPWNSPENLYVGFDPGCGGRIPYNGKMDDVQIWSRARTASEIANSYNKLINPASTNLTAYYRFDESNGRYAYDVTAAGNHGTITGTVTREIPTTAPLPTMATSGITYTWSPTTALSAGTGASVTANPTATTTYTVTATNTTTGCTNTNVVRVQVNPLPAAPTVTSPVVYCQGATSVPLTATATAAGLSFRWYTVATGGTGSTTAPTPSTVTAGSTTYYVCQVINATGCEGPRAAITVTVNAMPAAPAVTSPVNLCVGGPTGPLTATKATATDTLYWYTTPTGGTGSITAPTPSTATVTTTNWYVSAKSVAGCEGNRATITVNVNPLPAAPGVTTPVVYCQGATASALTAVGTNLKWYTTATGGTGSTTAPVPSTATVGSTTWYVSSSSSAATGSCEGPRSAITVTINATPTAPVVVTPVTYCVGATPSPLSATKLSVTDTIFWYSVATGGTGSTATPTPSTATAGTTLYYVSLKTNLGCEGPRATITVNVNPLPAAPTVTTPVLLCVGGPSSALTATGTSLKWYTTATGGTGSATAPTPSTATVGTTTWYVSQTNTTTGCEGPRAAINVVINALPAAPTVTTPVNLCVGGPTAPLTATGTSLLWYTAATGGTGSATAPTPSTASVGSTTWYVTQTSAASSGACESPRASITAIVNALPAAPTVVTPVNLCQNVPATALTAAGTNLKWYSVSTGGLPITPTPVPSTTTLGSTTYYVSQTSSVGCEGSRAALTVTVNPSPALTITPVGVPGFVFCDSRTVTLKATAPAAVSFQWQTGGASIPGATADTFNAGSKGYYGVTATSIYGCKTVDSVLVISNPLPAPTLSPTDIQQCEGVTIMLYCKPASAGYTYEWMKDGLPIVGVPTTATSVPVTLNGAYSVRVTDIYTCVKTTNFANLSTYPALVKPTIIRVDPILQLDKTYYRYQWYRNNKPIPGATLRTYTMSFDGSYFCEVTDVSECYTYSDTVQVTALSVKDQGNNGVKGSIKLYPNPTRDVVNIDAPIRVNVVVTDVVGKLVMSKDDVKAIDLSGFADGTYFFRIFDEQQQLISVEKINKLSNK